MENKSTPTSTDPIEIPCLQRQKDNSAWFWNPATSRPRTVGTYETYDLQGSYTGFKAMRVTLGIKNVLDRDPPYANHGSGFVGSYDLSYTDIRGRFLYASLAYMFK